MKILLNILGIQDSGGLRVLDKVLQECLKNNNHFYIVVCNKNKNINTLMDVYKSKSIFTFKPIDTYGFLHRLYYENIYFRKIISEEKVDLIYNFSGTNQLFLKTPQLLKIQNLLFYTKKIDILYKEQGKVVSWIKQILLKRIVFNFMSNRAQYIEIQASHVKKYMSDFIDVDKKIFFEKSDIDIGKDEFKLPKKYDKIKKIKFLYIVGPHFEYVHKNFLDFTKAMLAFDKLDIEYEINITLTQEQLESSDLWDVSLNKQTNFLGYLNDEKKFDALFSDNTILISTSVIETIGLHVVEAIKKGIVPLVPDEEYSQAVYGKNIFTYELFNTKSLLNSILSIINDKIDCEKNILLLQEDLKISESSKYTNITEIFQRIIKDETQ